MRPGKFIVFEGIDGSGKTTLCKETCRILNERGITCIFTYEPSDSIFGKRLRETFSNKQRLSLEEELELFMLDRDVHVNEVILPHLNSGIHVICDRYYFSTMAYQGARGADITKIREENEKKFPLPDLVILLDIPPKIAISRITKKRGDTLNSFEDLAYLEKVYSIFSQIDGPPPIVRIDAQDDLVNLLEKSLRIIEEVIGDGLKLPRYN